MGVVAIDVPVALFTMKAIMLQQQMASELDTDVTVTLINEADMWLIASSSEIVRTFFSQHPQAVVKATSCMFSAFVITAFHSLLYVLVVFEIKSCTLCERRLLLFSRCLCCG